MTPKMTQHGAQLGPFGESFGSFLETKKMMKKTMKTGYAVEPDPGAVGPSNKTIRPPGDGPNTPKRAWRHGGGFFFMNTGNFVELDSRVI